MGSANSHSAKSRALPQPAADRSRSRRKAAAVLLLLIGVMAVSAGSHRLGCAPAFFRLVLILSVAAGWMFHLRAGGMPRDWAFTFAAMLAGQVSWTIVHPQPSGGIHFLSIGNALFVYAMLWVFAIH